MAFFLSPVGGVAAQFFDNDGNVLSGGKIYTYVAGTSTPTPTYTTAAGNVPHSNPIILDSGGRVPSGEIWLGDATLYKFVLRDSGDALIATYDNISGINSTFVNYTNQQEILTATSGQTVFNLSFTYQPGTNSLSVFVDGVNQYGPGAQYAYAETDNNTVTFNSGLHVGAEVKFTTTQQQSVGAVDAQQVSYTPPFIDSVPTNVEAKLAQTISVKDFGAVGDGVTDDSAAIQAALDAAAATGQARVQFSPATRYKINSGLIVDISRVGIEGNGAWIDGTAITSGSAFSFTQSESDANIRTAFNHVNSIDHLFLQGPGGNYAASVAVLLEDNASPYTLAGGSFNHCAFLNWGNDVVNRSGSFCWTFNKCAFTLTVGVPTTYSITFPQLTNNGERNMFIDCFWFNRKYVVDCSNGNLSTMFIGCSIDGAGRAFNLSAGHTYMIGCHIEYVDDTDYWFTVSNENTLLSLENCEIISQSAKTSYSPFYSDSTAEMGGVVLKNCAFGIVASMTVPLIGGTGRAIVQNLVSQKSGSKPPAIAESQNYLAYGGFESANYTSEWTLSGGAIRSSAQARTGTYSLSFPASSGVTPLANMTMPAQPGQQVLGRLYYKVLNITGTSGTFYVEINWLDKGGNSLGGSNQLSVTTNVTNWTMLSLNFQTPAPKGTVSYKLEIDIFGTASGTPTAYVDDVILTAV
jgi:Pectate lyase superfamily protein